MKKVGVIGSGFSGLAAASCLAQKNYDVTIFEKNESAGGRARKFETDGFLFDMGPSWYWMPDVFEKYFALFGKKPSDFFDLHRLDPSYRVFFGKEDVWDVPAGEDRLCTYFETIEKGSGAQLKQFLAEGKYKYDVGINKLVYKPGISISELLDLELAKGVFKLHVFESVSAYVKKHFKDPRLIQLLEFPVLFLGAPADKTPALYTLMNYADVSLGTWYPMGGMHKIVEGMVTVAKELGVKFEYNSAVEKIIVRNKKVSGIQTNGTEYALDYLVAGADYHHVEQELLPAEYRRYSEDYWQKRVMAPSSLIYYLGVNKRVKGLLHHNLFFDRDFGKHAKEIYESPQWPTDPLFYVSVPSKTDNQVAPEGCENIFLLLPVAPGLKDDETVREKYFNLMMDRIEKLTGDSWRDNIIYKRSYAHSDFISDYHAFKGNAYGLANTIMQTANLKPSILNKTLTNLFYTGQLTVPGPGVPPSLISGQVVAGELIKRDRA
ncbi:MAG: phytoene desaturase [Cyclobacteriaceae bacterium]|nr:phytoene desaturase [Cyclobacteriaceae bacterium]